MHGIHLGLTCLAENQTDAQVHPTCRSGEPLHHCCCCCHCCCLRSLNSFYSSLLSSACCPSCASFPFPCPFSFPSSSAEASKGLHQECLDTHISDRGGLAKPISMTGFSTTVAKKNPMQLTSGIHVSEGRGNCLVEYISKQECAVLCSSCHLL